MRGGGKSVIGFMKADNLLGGTPPQAAECTRTRRKPECHNVARCIT